jgi:hypothetical protein
VLSPDEDDMALLIHDERQTGAILLYNLGLVYNNIGVHLGVSAAVPHAIRLYQWSLSFLDVQQDLNICNVYPPPTTTTTGPCDGPSVDRNVSGGGAGRKTDRGYILSLQQQCHHRQQQQQIPFHQGDTKLLLAVLNNLSNLYTSLNCVSETHYALYRLRMVLAASTMTDHSTDGTNNGMIAKDEDYNWFFINALFNGKELNFAPAA